MKNLFFSAYKKVFSYITSIVIFMVSLPYAYSQDVVVNTTKHLFTVKIGTTRVIYPSSSTKGVSVSVANPQDYPILVQTQVKDEDKTSPAPFIVTPPLFRLDAGLQGRVRIIRTGGKFPEDRETLQWLCLTGIPPKNGDAWGNTQNNPKNSSPTMDIQMSISTCIKLLFRPDKVKGDPTDSADSLTWRYKGNYLEVNNPTPFYMNFYSLRIGDEKINLSALGSKDEIKNGSYVPPFSSRDFIIPVKNKGKATEVFWQVINDNGGVSREFKSTVQ